MNRREFTASLAAMGFLPALPIAAPASAAAAPSVPAGVYAWAHLIARAQAKCSAAMLARQLHLGPEVAAELFREMIAGGVLKAPGAAGMAQAAKPIDATGVDRSIGNRIREKLSNSLQEASRISDAQSDGAPLANSQDPCLGCADNHTEDQTDASTDQSLKESVARG